MNLVACSLTRRELTGVWGAPLAAPVLGFLFFYIPAGVINAEIFFKWQESLGYFLMTVIIVSPISWFLAGVLGVPVLNYLRYRDRLYLPWVVASSALIGAQAALIPMLLLTFSDSIGFWGVFSDIRAWFSLGICTLLGVVVGWVYWLMVYQDRQTLLMARYRFYAFAGAVVLVILLISAISGVVLPDSRADLWHVLAAK